METSILKYQVYSKYGSLNKRMSHTIWNARKIKQTQNKQKKVIKDESKK